MSKADNIEKAFILKSLENQEKIDEELAKLEAECWEEINKKSYKELRLGGIE